MAGIDVRTVIRAIGRGELAAKKQGRSHVVRRESVEEWLNSLPDADVGDTAPERSWSVQDVSDAWQIPREQIVRMVREGEVGYFKGKRGSFRFFTEHIKQIRDALVFPASRPVAARVAFRDEFSILETMGVSPRSVKLRRNRAIANGSYQGRPDAPAPPAAPLKVAARRRRRS